MKVRKQKLENKHLTANDAKPVLYEVPTYLAGCPIGTLNRKTKRKKR